jgi:hypothetical protein
MIRLRGRNQTTPQTDETGWLWPLPPVGGDAISLLDNNFALSNVPRELRGPSITGATAQTIPGPLLALPGLVACYL